MDADLICAPGPVVEAAQRAGVRALPIGVEHATAVAQSQLTHAVPFDRLLVARAATDGMADAAILRGGLLFAVDARA